MVKSYGDNDIVSLNVMQHVRLRSEMYLGRGGVQADYQMYKEIVDNAADESILPNKIYNVKILIFKKGKRYQLCVIDYGRGVPCNKLKDIFTKAFTGGKYTDDYGGSTSGTNGIGGKAVAALSRTFLSISKRMDGFAGLTLKTGEVKDFTVNKAIDKKSETVGTIVFYETDPKFMHESYKFISEEEEFGLPKMIDLLEIKEAFKNTRFEMHLIDGILPDKWFEDYAYIKQWKYFQELTGKVIYKSAEDVTPLGLACKRFGLNGQFPVLLEHNIDGSSKDIMTCDFKIGFTDKPDRYKGYLAVINGILMNDPLSDHVLVLTEMIKKYTLEFIDEDDTELRLFYKRKYRLPISGYINATAKGASYMNQTKDGFNNVNFANMYRTKLKQYFKTIDPNTWGRLFDLIQEDVEKKFMAANKRANRTGRSLKNISQAMLREGTYYPCRSNDREIIELLLVEGDSALGNIKQVRDEETQAILVMGGVPINTWDNTPAAIDANKSFQDLKMLIGVDERDADLSNMNFAYVGMVADPDPDGAHIMSLWTGNIGKINPLILAHGRLFMANPPLYVMETNGHKDLFLRDRMAMLDAQIDVYRRYIKISILNIINNNACELDDEAFRDFVFLTKRMAFIINEVAVKTVVDAELLEQLVYCSDYLRIDNVQVDKIKLALHLEDCVYNKYTKILTLITDSSEFHIPLNELMREIRAYILPEMEYIRYREIQPLVTTIHGGEYTNTPLGFMAIARIFDKFDEIYQVRRIKGLGECRAPEIEATCVNPATRTIKTITSMGDLNDILAMLGPDPKERKMMVRKDNGR